MTIDIKKLKISQYEHGGSRIYIDGEPGKRQLLADTYHTKEFAEYIYQFIILFYATD